MIGFSVPKPLPLLVDPVDRPGPPSIGAAALPRPHDIKSPRAAAETPKGREKLAAWLKVLENHSARRPAGDPIGDYDFGWMWQELGVEALRQ